MPHHRSSGIDCLGIGWVVHIIKFGEVEFQQAELIRKRCLVSADVGSAEVLFEIFGLITVVVRTQRGCEERLAEPVRTMENQIVRFVIFQHFDVACFVNEEVGGGTDLRVSAVTVRKDGVRIDSHEKHLEWESGALKRK